ncbi:MAG: DUF839 domain-containing protein [Gammaproteobacteria bacterium]|nr:DUF839 domain-containing protein [Gammaproteobacteria bacterium]
MKQTHFPVRIITAAVLVALGSLTLVAGCSDDDDDDDKKSGSDEGSISFSGVAAPTTDAEKRAVLASDTVTVDGTEYSIGYNTLVRSGDTVGEGTFGLLHDAEGNPLMNEDGTQRISDSNDFASLLPVGDKLFMVSHFETRPAAMYLTELSQDADSGQMSAVNTRNIDFSGVRGGWVHCAGSVTPWNTHLGSEEYPPDVRTIDPETGDGGSYYNAMADYYGGDLLALEPYDYGYQVEVTVKAWDDVDVVKHYSMGRVAHELGYVMPDQKTAYITDDGTNVGLFRFVAATAGDLSSGELFAAKWTQTSAVGAGAADISWVSLGSASNSDVRALIDGGITFDDIFDAVDPAEDGTCADGYTSINTEPGQECLTLKDGMEVAASRLETRRYAAMLGATTEFRKMEGVTHDPATNTLYLAMSEVAKGMEDGSSNDTGGPNHIRLEANTCGAVYSLALDSDYAATSIASLVEGTPIDTDELNSCDLDGIANPDNVTFITGYNTLIIGEDTGSGHQNDVVWAMDLSDNTLTRIQTTPYGSETTSPYWYPNINGHAYLMSVIQHPFGESDEDQAMGNGDTNAYTGYIGPFPAMD